MASERSKLIQTHLRPDMEQPPPAAAPTPTSGGAEPLPRVLVIDDSRLVRASIIKHLKGVFDYVEAGDGQAGWEQIVLDPTIRVVISDLSMPRLNGYQLLEKIRNATANRIRQLPVVIISGDEEEAAKAAQFGATEFITKGVSTVELLSRIEVLLRLQSREEKLEQVRELPTITEADTQLASTAYFDLQSEKMWAFSRRHGIDFVVLAIRLDDVVGLPVQAVALRRTIRERIFSFIADMLAKAMRREDCVARSGDDEFIVAAMGISPNGAIKFAHRLAEAIAAARIHHGEAALSLTASFGIAAASQTRASKVETLRQIASRRVDIAQKMGGNRVVGMIEEGEATGSFAVDELDLPPMTLSEALNLIERGQGREVLPYLTQLESQIQPLNELILQQKARRKVTETGRLDYPSAGGTDDTSQPL